jgi:Spy/CpxP family protein refolding chaperone
MKRYLITGFAVTAILVTTVGIFVGCRHEGKIHRYDAGDSGWAKTERGQGRGMSASSMMFESPMMGRGFMMEREGFGAGKVRMYLNHAQSLKLTDAQIKKLKDIEAAFLKDMIDKRAKLATARVDLNQVLDSDNPDMIEVEKNVRAAHEISADLEIAVIKGNKVADAVLTASQKKAVKDMIERTNQNRPMRGMGKPGMMMQNRQGQAGRSGIMMRNQLGQSN